MLADECALIVERHNGRMVTEATLIQAAVASLLGPEGGKVFKGAVERLSVEATSPGTAQKSARRSDKEAVEAALQKLPVMETPPWAEKEKDDDEQARR
jgi:hypothetical protein